MRGLEGMQIVVAGGGAGIGAAVVGRLFDEGAKIVIGDINETAAKQLASDLSSKKSGHAVSCWFDLGDEASINALIQKSMDSFGGVDGLVNMAALVAPEIVKRDSDVLRMDPDVWKTSLEVNLVGFGIAIKAILPHMIAQNRGSVVNMSSGAAAIGLPYIPPYASSKAGINALTRHCATTYGRQEIRVNGVAFGMIATESVKRNNSQQEVEQGNINPSKRVGMPEEAASLVCYLLSEDASFIT
ncbi:putative short-chain type dehydrogenase/reductase [Lasiodiplodia hormozganensis]|uniref:Short-chain type dehydrogenase/reductase n=1 Tax=Lasiodiplodia hormozganensis TaxID=869390 RepID=A0AA40BZ10_9PEZI|nr:putative short-chain type dehydrogenase/reductase [Lasiodiplodia hormozganensis]